MWSPCLVLVHRAHLIKGITVAERTRKDRRTEHKDEESSQADDSDRYGQWEVEIKFCTEKTGHILK